MIIIAAFVVLGEYSLIRKYVLGRHTYSCVCSCLGSADTWRWESQWVWDKVVSTVNCFCLSGLRDYYRHNCSCGRRHFRTFSPILWSILCTTGYSNRYHTLSQTSTRPYSSRLRRNYYSTTKLRRVIGDYVRCRWECQECKHGSVKVMQKVVYDAYTTFLYGNLKIRVLIGQNFYMTSNSIRWLIHKESLPPGEVWSSLTHHGTLTILAIGHILLMPLPCRGRKHDQLFATSNYYLRDQHLPIHFLCNGNPSCI